MRDDPDLPPADPGVDASVPDPPPAEAADPGAAPAPDPVTEPAVASVPRARPLARAALLILIGAGLASIGFWLFGGKAGAPPAPSIDVVLDDGGVARPAHPPVLPAPDRGPGDQQLAGVVVDGAGLPVADVHVTAELEVGFAAPDPARDAAVGPIAVVGVADAVGHFAIQGLIAGRYRVRVEGAPIFTGELRMVGVPSDELRVVALRRVAVVGAVVDGGQPVRGAQVWLAGDGVTGRLTLTTDADGRFAFPELPEGTYQVWATSGDLAAPAQRALRQGAGPFPALALALEPAAIVVGRVVARAAPDDPAPRPVLAAIALYPASDGERGDEPPRFARTDADGVFRIEGVPHGRWTAQAYAPGYVTTGVLAFEAGTSALTIELDPGGTIDGTVVDAAGRPVAGIEVQAFGAGPDGLAREASAVADDDRLRAFDGIAIAAPTDAPAAPTADPRFVAKGELGVLLGPIPYPPPPTARAARRVVRIDDAPRPAPAGAATATPVTAVIAPPPLPIDPARAPIWATGADGKFRIPGLGRGSWVIVARGATIAVTRSKPVMITTSATALVELVVGPGVTVVGTISDQRGTPIAGASVTAVLPIGGGAPDETLEAFTDSAGAYRLGPVAGAIRIHASAYGHTDAERAIDLGSAAGDPREARVDLQLVTADAVLAGEIDDPTGLPIAGVRLTVIARKGDPANGRTITADAAGRFRLAGLPPGALTVRAEASGFPAQELATTATEDLRLQLAFGGGIEGVVFDHHTGQPIGGAALTATGPGGATIDGETGVGGDFALAPLAVGRWKLTLALPGYLAIARTLDVTAGDRAGAITIRDLRLELERGALLGGVIRDRYGSRVPGAEVTVRRTDGDEVTTARGTTDADGAFRLRDVPTGALQVTVTLGDLRGADTVTLRPGDEFLSLQIEIK